MGAEPTSTWKPSFISRIICITFSMLPELSLMAMMFGMLAQLVDHVHRNIDAGRLRPVVDHQRDEADFPDTATRWTFPAL